MPERTFSSPEYRYGFNGKEKDESGEWGSLTHYDYGFRIYNPGIAKFLSVDPLTQNYPMFSPYHFAGNSPIQAIDLDGLEMFKVTTRSTAYNPRNSYAGKTLQNVALIPDQVGQNPNGEWEYTGVPGIQNGVYRDPQFLIDGEIGQYLQANIGGALNMNKAYDIAERGARVNDPNPSPSPTPPDVDPIIEIENDDSIRGDLPRQTPPTPPVPPSDDSNTERKRINSLTGQENMCWDCYIGTYDTHFATSINRLTELLLENGGVLTFKPGGGAATGIFSDDGWEDNHTMFDNESYLERLKRRFEFIQQEIIKRGGGNINEDQIKLDPGPATSKSLEIDHEYEEEVTIEEH